MDQEAKGSNPFDGIIFSLSHLSLLKSMIPLTSQQYQHTPEPEPAAAIIIAGGASRRMGYDKSLIPIAGKPMIAHIYQQLLPYFRQILISSNDPTKFTFLNAPVVVDKEPGVGPLMGIVCGVESSPYDLNFVVACDIPDIDIPLMRTMLTASVGYDCVIPQSGEHQYEPLFAVYRKSILPSVWAAIQRKQYKVIEAFAPCKIKFIALPRPTRLLNLNTVNDYQNYRKNYGRVREHPDEKWPEEPDPR